MRGEKTITWGIAGLLAAALITATAATAEARPYNYHHYSSSHKSEKFTFDKPRLNLGLGMLVGGYSVGPIDGPAVGVHLDVGRQMGALSIYGEYNLLSIGESSTNIEDPVRGMLNRFGVNARYHFVEFSDRHDKLQGAFWVEGGLGQEQINWQKGGVLRRQDVSFGFGAQFNVRIGDRYKPNPKVFGFYYAFKATIARAPDSDKVLPPTCGGPCDYPTPPSPNDFGLYFNFGLQWGR